MTTRRRLRPLAIWRSPAGQPRWARPALLAIAAVAAFSYTWNVGITNLEPFYGAAARSMSENWHNFIFGAFDPWGTVSVDKLPGALWFQALSIRVFGAHTWAIVLPQGAEGTLTVLALYRAVRRVAGPKAGLVAALILAVSPATTLLDRGNISDSLLILLLVLAADATTRAIVEDRPRSLVTAGLWVGLAFQAKMLQAWLVLPALYLAYLVAAPTVSALRRCRTIVLSALVVVLVSLSWMSAVSAVPAHSRPYVDGSCDNSLFSQVFLYNGLDRFSSQPLLGSGCTKPSLYLVRNVEIAQSAGVNTGGVHTGWDRLLTGIFGRDVAWLMIPTVLGAAGVLVARRRRPRPDPTRAAALVWTAWLVLTFAFFSTGRYLNSYYTAAMVPAMAALCALGAAEAWRHRADARVRVVVLVAVVAGAAYSVYLVPSSAGLRPAILGSVVATSLLAAGILAASLRHRPASVWSTSVGLVMASIALLGGSAWAAGSVVNIGQDPFASPLQAPRLDLLNDYAAADITRVAAEQQEFAYYIPRNQSIDTIESSYIAGNDILATGREYLSVGGFTGQVPAPPLPEFIRFVAERRVVRVVIAVSPMTNNTDLRWAAAHCTKDANPASTLHQGLTTFQLYVCSPSAATGG